jgi:hypothetical protein
VESRLAAMPTTHPRLFMNQEAQKALVARLTRDPLLMGFHRAVIGEADKQLDTKPVEQVKIGRRLLDKSRTFLSRMTHLSYAWRLTREVKYLERAKAEMLAVAAFSDWNPSHFLDVAEMTAGMAVGYDWLHAGLDEATRNTVRNAIIDKGVKESFGKSQWWIRGNNNWNQVCHAGMVMGVLAVHDTHPTLSAEVVARAVDNVPHSMVEFGPDGAYPEGPGYWAYGTTFNVLLLSAMETALGTDFTLCSTKGFLATADYYLHVVGPTNLYFNYEDCGSGGGGIQPAMFWFAARRKEPYLLWSELGKCEEQMATAGDKPVRSSDRTFPLLLAWAPPLPKPRVPPPALSWSGGGLSPVGLHRSAWTPDATYVAIKGGSPSTNHAHMDVGCFVMDADGVRWAEDLGMQDYNSLEAKKINLWNMKQDSQRWKVYRLGASAHNILTVDGQQQVVQGKAPIVLTKAGCTVIDTSGVYKGQLTTAQRGVRLLPDRSVLVQDEFTAEKDATVRWAMLTRAEVAVTGPGQATLKLKDKTLTFRIVEPAHAEVKIWSTDPPNEYDVPNPGTRLVGFQVKALADAAQRLVVHLVPRNVKTTATVQPLASW